MFFYKQHGTYNPQLTKGKPYTRTTGKNYGANYSKENSCTTINEGTRYPASIIRIPNENDTQHPTHKPVDLFAYLIRTYTNEGDIVLDNCIGSGTTAVACIKTNRKYIGFELSKEYYTIAIERITNEKQIPLIA